MSRRGLVVLIAALALLAVVAGVVGLRGRGAPGAAKALLPDLKATLNDISQITVRGAGNKTIATLTRGAQRWTVAERNNYPADVGKIRENLIALADASIVETKTSNPEYYDRLGVDDVAKPAARGLQLDLRGPKATTSIIVGDTNVGGGNQAYVRQPGMANSWLVTGRFDLGKATGDWLDREVLDIPATRIQSVTISHPGSETLGIGKAARDNADFQVQDLPAGRELAYAGAANAIGGVLAALALDDVQTRDALGADPGKPVVARFATFDGLVIEASAWRVSDGTRVTFTASTDKALADRFAPAGPAAQAAGEAPAAPTAAAPAAAKPDASTGNKPPAMTAAAKVPTFDDAVREAAAINQRLGAWVYTLPSYKSDQLTKHLKDLLKPVADKAAAMGPKSGSRRGK